MLKKLFLLLPFMAMAACAAQSALADSYGQGIIPVGGTKQASATTSSGGTQVAMSAVANYVLVQNESATIWAYVSCTGNAAVPSANAPNSTPVAPDGKLILNSTIPPVSCAAITASSTATVDFTPVNLF